jgi:hypothetical protein
LQLSSTGIVGIVFWYVTNAGKANEVIGANWGLSWGVVFMIPLLCGYLIFDILHTIYSMTLLGIRTNTIEDQVTKLAGPNLLMWEKISKVFYSKARPGRVYNPACAHAALTVFVIIIFMLVVPLFGYGKIFSVAHEASMPTGMLMIILGVLSALVIVGICFYYGMEILLKMRPKAEVFVSDLMSKQLHMYDEAKAKDMQKVLVKMEQFSNV